MKVDIRVTDNFKKAAKSLIKKYPSLKFELLDIEEVLQSNPSDKEVLVDEEEEEED